MSERLSITPEHHQHVESPHDQREMLERKQELAKQAEREAPSVESARAAVEKLAQPISAEQSTPQAELNDVNDGMRWWSSELRSQALERMLTSVRHRLKPNERRLSKVIHQPVVEKVSDVAGNTVVRPSGILFGGIFSFIGSLGAYLLAKHLGGEFRFSIFAVCFVGGFAIGLIVELVWRTLRLRKLRT